MVFIFCRRFQFMILSRCLLHLRYLQYFYFSGAFSPFFYISNVCSITAYYVIYILRLFQFMILNQSLFQLRILCYLYLKAFSIHDFKSVLRSTSGYYVIYIFQAFPIHDVKSVLFVPPQDTMLFIFFRRFQFIFLNQYCLFHLRILCYLYFIGVFNS